MTVPGFLIDLVYLIVALSWALLSFVGSLALAKHLEGRSFDE